MRARAPVFNCYYYLLSGFQQQEEEADVEGGEEGGGGDEGELIMYKTTGRSNPVEEFVLWFLGFYIGLENYLNFFI